MLAQKTQTHFSIQGSIIQTSIPINFPICAEEAKTSNAKRRSKQWGRANKVAYGKLLLSYLMNNLEVNHNFIEHLADVLRKSCREVGILHRKMLAEHRSVAVIVTNVLRHRTENPSHQILDKLPTVARPSLISLPQYLRQQEQKLDHKEEEYLRNLVFAEQSLENYEENLSEDGVVEDLDDQYCVKQERTNDSFDFDENNEQQGNENEDSTFDYLNR